MNSVIKEVASILLYSGPTLLELVNGAINDNKEYRIDVSENHKKLEVVSKLPYNTLVTDKYFYDENEKLIKHILVINEEERIVFDKYNEAVYLLDTLPKYTEIA